MLFRSDFNDDLGNIEEVYKVDQELRSFSLFNPHQRILRKENLIEKNCEDFDNELFRPSNPMVHDDSWNLEYSVSTEGEYDVEDDSCKYETVGVRHTHSL